MTLWLFNTIFLKHEPRKWRYDYTILLKETTTCKNDMLVIQYYSNKIWIIKMTQWDLKWTRAKKIDAMAYNII
jgi:hypothetical protein